MRHNSFDIITLFDVKDFLISATSSQHDPNELIEKGIAECFDFTGTLAVFYFQLKFNNHNNNNNDDDDDNDNDNANT